MKSFWRIFKTYVFPYRGYAGLNISFNLLGVIFSLLSLILIGPFLQVLFGTQPIVNEAMPWELSKQALEHNFNYFISQQVVQHSEQQALLVVSLLVIVLFFLKTANIFLANFFMSPIRNGVVKDIRNQIYQKMLHLPIGFFSDEKKGDLMSRVTQDVQEIEWSIMASLEKFFRDPINILIFLIGLFLISPLLTVFVLVLLPVSAIAIGQIGKNLRKSSTRSQAQMGRLMSFLEESLSGLRVIKAFNAEKTMQGNFEALNQDYTHTMNRITRKRYLASPLSEFLGAIVIVVLLTYGGNLVIGGKSELSASAFIAYIAIFSQLLTPAKSFSTAFYHLQKGLASYDRVNEILAVPIQIKDPAKATRVDQFNHAIAFHHVEFAYGTKPVLHDISIQINKGQTVALVGHSGSGKSTFIDLIPRFHDVNQGSITIDGIDIRQLKIVELRGLLGYVHQEPLLFNDSFLNNITMGDTKPDEEKVFKVIQAAHATEFIESDPEGIHRSIGDRGGKLSGGQRQRISIARALYSNPEILLLDEATSSLDSDSERQVQEALQTLMKGRTTIVVAHRLSTIIEADLIVVFKDGRIVEQGSHQELIELNGEYLNLYEQVNQSTNKSHD